MTFHIITIFPGIFTSYFNESILKRAQQKKILKINVHNLRDWSADKHHRVDDRPYGGGAGMLLMAEPIMRAVKTIRSKVKDKKLKVVLLSAKGKKWTQTMAKRYAKSENVILICGRYEGVDERVKKVVDEEISIGDYVLTGGEIGAMAIVDSVARLLPGVLGNEDSAVFESHAQPGVLEHPHYTRPEVLEIAGKNYRVPKVLLSGNHEKIEKWRKLKSKKV
ncbi:tRNA (guanosine(37)-N1)-methyltransferase TrmD [Candidatus Falkowbacteria bacterium RIFOXYC2_FULL_47_12]|uniref:tRNA (guanine-N(1)-)-methyltransferase n=1 Tax=Candidatus Falkowbacteria bacterium RIFOXYC2_FULL_47_12 TaxID=1798004 RepID=A0A1F5TQR3_9BACT|nr:MAG: tRNA (guanosine(37)-N1)-methyltransferase TrmD [Candidatus Falkowbacteria bacterium RIFOXYC2_FULL_47_12]